MNPDASVAYFSMEMALCPEMHTYSGGLGVLAGDTARSCADLELPIVFVTLVSREGYLHQDIDEGRQVESPDPWDPALWAEPLDAKIAVSIEGRHVWIRPWLYTLRSTVRDSATSVLLLDTDLEENEPDDRKITHYLYGGDQAYRLKQEIVLGVGGAQILRALGFQIKTYHLNEGHAAFLTLELLRRYRSGPEFAHSGATSLAYAYVRDQCVFTTHTPVGAGHDKFNYDLIERLLGDFVSTDELKTLAGEDMLDMTQLALSLSRYVNGVAERHAETSQRIYPGYRVHAITNGVHVATWTHPSFARLYQDNFPYWASDPETLSQADQLADSAVWQAHQQAKADLILRMRSAYGIELDPTVPIVAFARRMTGYKRPDLLFSDLERLVAIAREQPFQVILAGKAHPRDTEGKHLIQQIEDHARTLSNQILLAFIPGYDLTVAGTLVSGADIWLNTPMPPLEASGTSGMKAALNGLLNLSVLDGWWREGCIDGVTGWAIGDGEEDAASHADALYTRLETNVLPTYYGDRDRWIWMMKQAISKIGSYFDTHRMVQRYATEAYFHGR